MTDALDVTKCFEDLLESAFLPKLKKDLDSTPIEKEHFLEYQKSLKATLPLIFDLVQQQQELINANPKLHSSLLLLCCELTAPETIFGLDDDQLLGNAQRILQVCRELRGEEEELIFEYYKTRLRKDEWKRNLGAVHGFEQYLKCFYNGEKRINLNLLSFCLSVALTVRDCHESCYKHLGIRVFLILLKYSRSEDMVNLNIHNVIYDNVFKDVHFMESVPATEDIWNCLYLCLDYLQNIDSFNWSQVDDLLEILIRNVPLASNNSISICMLNFIPKMSAYFTLNRDEIMMRCYFDLDDMDNCEKSYECCAANTSYCCFRWAKSILDLIVFESYKLLHGIEPCLDLLSAMHRCYMVCILPIPLQVAESHLLQFYEKFTSVLMEAVNTHKRNKDVIKFVKMFLKTFIWQLKTSSYTNDNSKLNSMLQSFERLVEHTVFL